MKLRIGFFVIVVFTVIWWWQGTRPSILTQGPSIQVREGSSPQAETGHADHSGPDRTKAANRGLAPILYTHSPERLQEFMLPAMVIDGLTLDGALKKLIAAYEDTCQKSGETSLPLTFDIPLGSTRKLKIHLPAGSFDTSIQVMASLSGATVSRKKREYRFEPMPNERKSVAQNLRVSPSFETALKEMAGLLPTSSLDSLASSGTSNQKSIQDCLNDLVQMDPSTQVSLDESGQLKIETMNTADAAMISELAKSLNSLPKFQMKIQSKLVELPVGTDWNPPDVSQMDEVEIQRLIGNFALRNGTELITLPSVTARSGQDAQMEIMREFIYPTDDAGENFEKREIGKVLKVQGNLLGFGQEVDVNFSDTTGGIDEVTGTPAFEKRTELANKSYMCEGKSKFLVQTRPDGSRTVLLVQSQIIDATGSPIR